MSPVAHRPSILNDITSTIKTKRELGPIMRKLDRAAPKAGDMAPDFTLSDATGKSPVTLSQFRGERPVVLFFGSYT
jgi:hypothetical protein